MNWITLRRRQFVVTLLLMALVLAMAGKWHRDRVDGTLFSKHWCAPLSFPVFSPLQLGSACDGRQFPSVLPKIFL